MNLYPKSAHLFEFIPNSCQFMLIFSLIILVHLAHTPHINTPVLIFEPKTNISTKKPEKIRISPQFLKKTFYLQYSIYDFLIKNRFCDVVDYSAGVAVGVVCENREYIIALLSDAQAGKRPYATDISGFA